MKLFEPLTVRGMTLKNRIVMPPMLVLLGFRGSRPRAYFVERAKGGVGTIIAAGTSVDLFLFDNAWGRPGAVSSFIEAARLFTDEVREAGAKIGVQLWHGNRFPLGMGIEPTGDAVAPSAKGDARELTIGEIEEIISRFGQAAAKAREAGFDFAEVHGAHSYLPCRFFSPAYNHRTDKYGGDLAGRMRFGIECVIAMRKAAGDGFPLFWRLGAWEDGPDGITIEDSATFGAELEKAGIDVLDISYGTLTRPDISVLPGSNEPEGTTVPYAAAIKQRVTVPVIAVGGIKTSQVAEAIVSQGKADLIAIGRQLIADPFWPQKVAEGRPEDIAPCLRCNTCLDSRFTATGLRCAVNPSVAKELEYQIKPAEKAKKVIVIGGGPAGMEASRVAAMRGHGVTLYEKKSELGGQLLVASLAPYKDDLKTLTRYLTTQLEKTGVKVRLGEKASAESVLKDQPDAVVVATGARPAIPNMSGVKGSNVVSAIQVLAGEKEVGDRVAIIGGGMVGCETGEFLAQRGKRVTILEMLEEIGSDIGESIRKRILYQLEKAGVEMVAKAKVEEVTAKGVMVNKGGVPELFEADTVVLAVGFIPNNELTEELKGKVANLYSIGDCTKARKIVDAIGDGARVGREI